MRPGSEVRRVGRLGSEELPAGDMPLGSELIAPEDEDVDVFVVAGGSAEEEVEGRAARDPPPDGDGSEDSGDFGDGERAPVVGVEGHR